MAKLSSLKVFSSENLLVIHHNRSAYTCTQCKHAKAAVAPIGFNQVFTIGSCIGIISTKMEVSGKLDDSSSRISVPAQPSILPLFPALSLPLNRCIREIRCRFPKHFQSSVAQFQSQDTSCSKFVVSRGEITQFADDDVRILLMKSQVTLRIFVLGPSKIVGYNGSCDLHRCGILSLISQWWQSCLYPPHPEEPPCHMRIPGSACSRF